MTEDDVNLDDFDVLDEYHMLIEDKSFCGRCGDRFEIGEKIVTVPAFMAVVPNQIEFRHRDCAAADKYPR